jgi:hypothetical protein
VIYKIKFYNEKQPKNVHNPTIGKPNDLRSLGTGKPTGLNRIAKISQVCVCHTNNFSLPF